MGYVMLGFVLEGCGVLVMMVLSSRPLGSCRSFIVVNLCVTCEGWRVWEVGVKTIYEADGGVVVASLFGDCCLVFNGMEA